MEERHSTIVMMYLNALETANDRNMNLYTSGIYFHLKLKNGKIVSFHTISEVHHYLNGYADAISEKG